MSKAPKITLYEVPGSPNVLIARLMLEHKGLPYRRVQLIQGVHRVLVRLLGFPAGTVPALKIDGDRVQGSRDIARALDRLRPEPPLFPADRARRRAVEEAERWGEEVVQSLSRRFGVWMALRAPSASANFVDHGPLRRLPPRLAGTLAVPFLRLQVRVNRTGDEPARAALSELSTVLDRVDELIRAGVLGEEQPTAADFQISAHVRMLMCFDDLSPLIEGRPAADLALRLCPELPGRLPPVLTPAERAVLDA